MRIVRNAVRFVTASVCLSVLAAAVGAWPRIPETWPPGLDRQEYPPGLLFSTVLDNIAVNANGGWVKIGTNLVGVFITENATGKLVLADGNGREICHWEWQAQRERFNAPFQSVNFRNAMAPDGRQYNAANLKLTTPGDYEFAFFLGDKKFYSFPISIKEVRPSGPFGEPRYLAVGDWNKWGYVHIPDASPDGSVSWKLWLREWEYELKTRKIEVELLRESDKKLIAENRGVTSGRFRHDWKREDYQLYKPQDRSLFKGRDLLGKDGWYKLTMKMNGSTYGVWRFQVSGGKLVSKGRTVRGKASPERFVEGGIDAFWYEMEPDG